MMYRMVRPMEKKTFIKSGEGATASYNWSDIQAGIGYVTFYGYVTRDGSPVLIKKTLTMNANPGYDSTGTTFSSSAITQPTTIKGTMLANWIHYSGTSPGQGTCTVYYNRGGVQTAISSAIATSDSYTTETYITLAVPLTETNLKIGDIIQIKITFGGGNGAYRQDTFQPTFDVPFKIEL